MRHRRLSIVVTWLGILVHLGIAAAAAPGLVLCVADDGHVVLETAHADARCTTDYERHHPEPAADAASDVDRHACTDTELRQVASRDGERTSASSARPAVVAVTLRHEWISAVAPIASAPIGRGGALHPPGSLAQRRTVVLLA
jgi:hypothetical protein